MDPQSISMVAARVALERGDTVDHEQHPIVKRRSRSVTRLTQLIAAPVTDLIASRRSAGRAGRPLPLGTASDG